MKDFIKRLTKFLAYFAAAIVILLAVAVGLFRLLLPRLPEYQEEIKDWAKTAIGMEVEFTGMNARWRFSGPEVNFYNAKLSRPDGSGTLLSVEELSVGVGLMRLLVDRELVADRVLVNEMNVELRQDENGRWLIQGVPLDSLFPSGRNLPEGRGGIAGNLIAQDIDLVFWPSVAEQPVDLTIDRLRVTRDDVQLDIAATVDLPDALGARIDVSANRRLTDAESGVWQFFVDGRELELVGWSKFQPPGFPVVAGGRAGVSLWLELSSEGIRSATANLVVEDLTVEDESVDMPIEVQGRFEYSTDSGGWLLAADNFRLQKISGEWPDSFFRVDVATDESDRITAVDANASFIYLDNLQLLGPWLPDEQRSKLETYGPTGAVHELELRLSGIQAGETGIDLSAELEKAGVRPIGKFPGVGGFSGQIRADRSGGLVEIDSRDLRVELSAFLLESVEFDDAIGTVIWRRNNESTIILSDSVRLRNADLDTRSSLQVILPADGGSPIVDFTSNWNITDVSATSRYLPAKIMRGRLYEWFDTSLLGGRIPTGTARLTGPLDKFPFDGGEGTFLIEGHAEDATLKFHPNWPALENVSADIIVENMRFYSEHNTATTLGNQSVDGRVEIADMRNPVLTIDAYATGTLETIRQFAIHSPIAKIFGGQLDRFDVDGEASFNLQLRYPIRDKLAYDFSTSIQSNNGRLKIDGFSPPLTELTGRVTVTRQTIDSEDLSARFLGEPVSIDLVHAGENMPQYAAIASATGMATANALVDELGVPLKGLLGGSTRYEAKILFPRGRIENPAPLRIAVDTDLSGMGLDVPAPMGKDAGDPRPLEVYIEFPDPDRIDSFGSSAEGVRWALSFLKEDGQWDFDRGVVALGGAQASTPETRGLHIIGETPEIRLKEWLQTAPEGGEGAGSGERIRSIDLFVDDLYVIGQHLSRHHVKLERGAQEWFIDLDGAQAVGSLIVPYDFSGNRPLVVEMEKLILPGGDDGEIDHHDMTDPRTLPPISIRVEEFSLGQRHFGSFAADFIRTESGLEAEGIRTEDKSFNISGSGRWVVNPGLENGQRSYLTAKLVSNDIEKTTGRLNYQPGLVGNDMEVDFDVSWPGGPRKDVLAQVDGEIGIRLGTGQLDDVEPGAGRVFGLMSIVALPRRLSLDFRDVFAKGFGFDEITGNFRIDSGETFTCNLTLKGPAADIGIIGHAGLVSREYNQVAIVSASVGDTLPIVGAVVAGPQVAAALLIFSRIFKKPLQDVGQIYYSIQGSWDDPSIETTDVEAFTAAYEAAGCPIVAQ
jgi:uncharacterized protein (TIGR02099 family)